MDTENWIRDFDDRRTGPSKDFCSRVELKKPSSTAPNVDADGIIKTHETNPQVLRVSVQDTLSRLQDGRPPLSTLARFSILLSPVLSVTVSGYNIQCLHPKVRKEWRQLSKPEKEDWIHAVNVLLTNIDCLERSIGRLFSVS